MKKVVIAGAGLVGSLLAYTLKKRGFNVTLFEKRSDMRKDKDDLGRSINLIVTSRGMNALKEVGLLDDVLEITVPVFGRMMHSISGELTYQAYGRDHSECNYSISRSKLNKLLMTKAQDLGVEIHFESALNEIDLDNKKSTFNDREVQWDLFFGTDGAGSPTRKEIIKKGYASESIDWLDSDYKELFMPAKGVNEYAIEENALHIWPRGHHMLMALPNQGGSFTMTLYLPKFGSEGFDQLKSREDVVEFFKKYYPDSISLMEGFEEEFFENPQGRLGTVKSSSWVVEDKVALLGDAAHAIVPFFGQGMNCGFEDVFYLTSLMDRYTDDWSKIFSEYDRLQRPNGDAIAEMALDNFIEMKDRVGDEEFLLKKKAESLIEKTYPEIYRARYGMVTYTLIPYAYTLEAGKIQNEILSELCQNIKTAEEVDLKKAKSLIEEKFLPFVKENKIALERYQSGEKSNFDATTLSFR